MLKIIERAVVMCEQQPDCNNTLRDNGNTLETAGKVPYNISSGICKKPYWTEEEGISK